MIRGSEIYACPKMAKFANLVGYKLPNEKAINNYSGSHNGKMLEWSDYFKYLEFVQYNKNDNPELLFNLKENKLKHIDYHENEVFNRIIINNFKFK